MSSFLINSNYVDPKFPPCEEYSHNDYLPSHSPEYYSGHRRDAALQHEAMFHQRSACTDQPYSSCQGPAKPVVVCSSPRGHVQLQPGLQNPLPEPNHHCESVTPSPPPACSQNSVNQITSSPTSSCKEPVVYPWMKKVHINIDGNKSRLLIVAKLDVKIYYACLRCFPRQRLRSACKRPLERDCHVTPGANVLPEGRQDPGSR
ncbi:UNVERIFIED_CONTAM: hypothetical protein FKN15_017991 [Acipenser sinensis]